MPWSLIVLFTACVDRSNSPGEFLSPPSSEMSFNHNTDAKGKVALDRIAVFLDEDEVTDQVSTLKKTPTTAVNSDDDGLLGIENGTFKWNAVIEKKDGAESAKSKKAKLPSTSSDTTIAASEEGSDTDTNVEIADHQFELRDISVIFPPGKLSCITGPTASGKTALLVSTTYMGVFDV